MKFLSYKINFSLAFRREIARSPCPLVKNRANSHNKQKNEGHKNCFKLKVMNVLEFQKYKEKRLAKKKNQTWLYKISFHELFDEFIQTYHQCEENPENGEMSSWLDIVSDALNERFFISSEKNAK